MLYRYLPAFRGLVLSTSFVALFTTTTSVFALEILSGPVFTPAPDAPLAGLLELTTDDYSSLSVSATDGVESWTRNFHDYAMTHAIPLLGFKPDRIYEITVTARDISGRSVTPADPIVFITQPLPANFPPLTVHVCKPEKMEPGYTLFRPIEFGTFQGYIAIVDILGDVVWYSGIPSNFGVTRLANGHLLNPMPTEFQELNMLGEIVRTWELPSGEGYHHEIFPTDEGTFLYLSEGTRVIENYPTSSTNPNAPTRTTNLFLNPVYEMSVDTGEILNRWFPIDMLDPYRISYMTFILRYPQGVDWSHANAVIEDPRDGNIIVSMRHQNAVIKFSRAGELKWILGPHENWGPEFQQYLLTPVGTPFEWNYAEHAPMVTPQGTILLYDNGNYRASPFDARVADINNFSRAAEFHINEDTMEVSQVWEYGQHAVDRIFTPAIGDANLLPETGNVLITFGGITYLNGARPSPLAPGAQMSRIKEVTHEAVPEVVFDLAVFNYADPQASPRGFWVYRSHRIPDLYPVIEPSDLLEQLAAGVALSGIPTGQSLQATLRAATASLERGDAQTAILQLSAFQHQVLAQVARRDADLASLLVHQAQGIIDTLTEG